MAQLASDLAPTLAKLARSLSGSISDGSVDAATELAAAIARADGDRGAAIVVAASLAGKPLGVAHVAPLTSLLEEPLVHFAVARATAEGPVALFVEAAARWLPHDKVGDRLAILGLWGAIRLGADEALARRRIIPLLRSLARRRQSPIEEAILATLAAELQHPDLLELAARGEAHRERDDVKQNIAAYEKDLGAEPLSLLAPFAWLGGATSTAPVVRAAPKAGRNDPCPCGSGKKYKKCCLEKDEAALAAPASPAAPVGGARSGRRLTKKEIAKLSVPELVDLDLTTLETERLGDVCRAFVDVRRLADAERCLAELARRGDTKELAQRRDEVLFRAAELGDADTLARQLALVDDRALLFPHDVTLALLRRDEHTLDTLLAAADRAARDSVSAEELALAVLRASPALGIVLARGAFGAQQNSDAMEVLLEEVEYARDALDLRGGDPAWRLYDLVVTRDEEAEAEEAAERAAEERARAVAEAAELRKSMRLQAAQLQKLENRLRAREEALAAAKQSTRRVRTPGAADPEEQKRLRAKIAELKARVKEANEERATLKRALAEQARARGEDVAETEPAAPSVQTDDDEIAGDSATAPRALLVPTFSARATDALGRITDRVAADALRTIGALAARDEHAWRAVKRAKDMPREVLMARLGIHHRLIFSTDRGTLEVLDIVPREGLDLALKRLRSL